MLSGRDTRRLQISPESTVKYYSAWILCGLLLLFCVSSRAARYGVQNRNLKLAASQSFLASDEAGLEAAIAALLLLGCVAILRVPRIVANTLSSAAAPAFVTFEASEYDRELHLRPPPRAEGAFA